MFLNSGILQFAVLVILSLQTKEVKGQGMPQYSQYMMDGFLINPAIAGSDGYTSYNLTARQQWVGLAGAPSTFSISGQTRILKGKYKIKRSSGNNGKHIIEPTGRVGLGGFVFNDRYGLIDRTGVQFSYAYHIFIREYQLSFGLSVSMIQAKLITEGITTHSPDDPLVIGNFNRVSYIPDATYGMCLTSQKYYFGFSVANLFQSTVKLGDPSMSNYNTLRQYYLTGGFKIELNTDFLLEPSTLIKLNELPIGQADLTCRLYYQDIYWGGMSYRINPGTGGDLVILFGVKVNRIYFGYAFDYTLNGIRKYSYGSHEITVGLKLGFSARRFPWVNRY